MPTSSPWPRTSQHSTVRGDRRQHLSPPVIDLRRRFGSLLVRGTRSHPTRRGWVVAAAAGRGENRRVRAELPTGTVTFLFTDIEGSTRLLHDVGAVAYADALAEHRRILRKAFARHGGVEVDTQGDAFFYAFPTAPGAFAAACEGQQALGFGPIRVRMGLHTGTPYVAGEGYVGSDVHRAARIAAAGHGGQVLLSEATRTWSTPSRPARPG